MANLGTANYEINTNVTEMILYMPSRVMQSSEHYLISFMSMASEIGGYVGLFLGVSFFHFARFIATAMEKKNQIISLPVAKNGATPPPKLTWVTPVD